ncbi:hypothetical protein BJF79_19080 [Actinomadura sp. CNU-125]|nr:hypothetical protein BJF79_19080 [Actinomadura sp. CNU-125]
MFRGAVTFAQLVRPDGDGGGVVPRVRIADGPAFAWRGLSLDVVRRFFTVDQVKKVVDLLALYKFTSCTCISPTARRGGWRSAGGRG